MNFDQNPALSADSSDEETYGRDSSRPAGRSTSHSPQQPVSQPSIAAVDLASENIAFTPGELLAQTAPALEQSINTPDIPTGMSGVLERRGGRDASLPPSVPAPLVKHRTPQGKLLIYLALIPLVVLGGVGIAGVAVHDRLYHVVPSAIAHIAGVAVHDRLYPYGGTLVFSDPLRDNSQGHHWAVGSDIYGGKCEFTGGAYHISDSINSPYTYSGGTATNFSNFAFEVQMTILKGDAGGAYFRHNPTSDQDYEFLVSQYGRYGLWRDDSSSSFQTLVDWTPNSAIHQGLGQTNLIAVVANGNTITAYVNNVKVASVTDSAFSHGQIWFVANPLAKGGHSTEVAFSNVKMWKF